MMEYVIDTSVAVKWFSREENDSGIALQLRQQILDCHCSMIAPDLLIYELANALRYNPNFTNKDVNAALDSVLSMNIDFKGVDDVVIARAIDIAFEFNVTVYDSFFMALSQREKKPFLTADYKFVERIKGFKGIVRLSDIKEINRGVIKNHS